MGLFDGMMGNASTIGQDEVKKEFGRLFGPDESVQLAYKLVRDVIILTDRRLILIDKQGVSGRKMEYRSFPYRAITCFSVESAGRFDLDAELKIWISGFPEPIQQKFGRGVDVYELQALLARHAGR